jgi:Kef-type K+ transport system membrane component KefB
VDDVAFGNLFGVCLVAFLIPFTLAFFPKIRLPAIVVELVAGIILGPSVLGLLQVDSTVNVVAVLGLSYLLFLAGLDLELDALRGATIRVALVGFGVSLALAVALGTAFHLTGVVIDPMLIAIILSATGLGVVLPVLIGTGEAGTTFGRLVIANSTIAEFATIVLLALLFSTTGMSPTIEAVLLLILGALAAVLLLALAKLRDSMAAGAVLQRLDDTSAQLRVRLALALLIGLLAVSERFGFEAILGAFVAGVILNVLELDRGEQGSRFTAKLEAIGFGFLVPVFFVTSGLRYDIDALLSSTSTMLRVPLFLAAILVVRGLPALLYRRRLDATRTKAAALLQATSLSFILAATTLGLELGIIKDETATALIAAGVISVLVFPATALGLLRRAGDPEGQIPAQSEAM